MRLPVSATVTCLLVLALGACGDVPSLGPGPCPRLRSVSVEPATLTLAPGEPAGVAVHAAARPDTAELDVRWTSGDTLVAGVEKTGVRTAAVTGRSEGAVAVTATVSASAGADDPCEAEPLSASTAVTVTPGDGG